MSDVVPRLNTALEGRYHIERELGEGGMATVYLADDLKHERKVALKVLKPELAAVVGAERFLTEIKTTANLQHPHILPLHDSGEADGFLYYVMPFVEGETLRERLEREKQLPVDEALRIATDVAEALHAAHERGVIHRDVKPANILLSAGRPLVADFGIALAVSAAGGGRLTETGLSMGTPFYMSPEQASADREPSAASDVYSLACVLYEMLVGDPPYTAGSAQAVLAKILTEAAPTPAAARGSIPPNVDAAIRKALEKLPADRFASAHDFSRALTDASFRHGEEAVAAGRGALWNPLSVTTTAVALMASGAAVWAVLRSGPPPPVERFESPFRDEQGPIVPGYGGYALSPDGSRLVYVGPGNQSPLQLWMRRWDDPDASPIRGTDAGWQASFSPDGTRLAFTQGGEVRVLSLDGGPVQSLAEGARPVWAPDGFIYLRTAADAIGRVPATGGPVEPVAQSPDRESLIPFDALPSGAGLLVIVGDEVAALRVRTGEIFRLVPGFGPQYATSGHLLYGASDGSLMAARFDADRLELEGPSVPLLEYIAAFTISDTGKLFYSRSRGAEAEFVWVTRTGQATPVDPSWTFDWGAVNPGWSLSPDGTRLAYRNLVDDNNDIWVKELPDGPNSRLTFDDAEERSPRWSPDGGMLVFSSVRSGNGALWTKPADGTGEAELIYEDPDNIIDGSWSPDREWLVLRTYPGGQTGRDIRGLRPGADTMSTPLLAETHDERAPALSRDGRWLAYVSDETGSNEVFVRPFPDVESGRWQVSTSGGIMPVWAHSGQELFFVDGQNNLAVARVSTAPGFQIQEREILFPVPSGVRSSPSNILFDVSGDDQRFLMARPAESSGAGGSTDAPYVLVNNYFGELERLVPR